MDVATEVGQGVLDRIGRVAGDWPPIPVTLAAMALVSGSELQQLFASAEESDQGTTWRVVGLTSTGLVVIDASSPQRGWNYRDSEDELQDGETLHANLTPLREFVSVGVTRVSDGSVRDDGWHYAVNWLLRVSDGSTIEISGTRRTRAELDALVVDLITALG